MEQWRKTFASQVQAGSNWKQHASVYKLLWICLLHPATCPCTSVHNQTYVYIAKEGCDADARLIINLFESAARTRMLSLAHKRNESTLYTHTYLHLFHSPARNAHKNKWCECLQWMKARTSEFFIRIASHVACAVTQTSRREIRASSPGIYFQRY